MLNKKQMLALMLGASTMGASYAIDLESLANADLQKFKGIMATLGGTSKPGLVKAFESKALQGDFEGIAADLSKVDLTPAIKFLADNMDNIKEKMEGFVKILQEQAPAKYKAVAQATDEKVQEKLALLDQLKTNLETIEPYGDLRKYQTIIAQALTAANNDLEFRVKLQEDIKASAAALKDLLTQIQKMDTDKIQKSLNAAPNLYTAYKNGTLSITEVEEIVAPGIGEIRKKLLPVAPAIAAELSATALEIYNILAKEPAVLARFSLDAGVIDALGRINELGIQLKNDFTGLNDKITELVKEVI